MVWPNNHWKSDQFHTSKFKISTKIQGNSSRNAASPHKTAVKSITLRRTTYLCKAALSFKMLSMLPWQHDLLLVMIFAACSQLSPIFWGKNRFFGDMIWNLSPKIQQTLALKGSLRKVRPWVPERGKTDLSSDLMLFAPHEYLITEFRDPGYHRRNIQNYPSTSASPHQIKSQTWPKK